MTKAIRLYCSFKISLLLSSSIFAKSITITYQESNNGKNSKEKKLYYENNKCYISEATDPNQTIFDFNTQTITSIISIKDIWYQTKTLFDSLQKPKLENKSENILGYTCQHVSYISFSNRIDLWYTTSAPAKGSPHRRFLPAKNALVLKLIINGNYQLLASKITENAAGLKRPPIPKNLKTVTEAALEKIKIDARFIRLPVFQNTQINFKDSPFLAKNFDANSTAIYHLGKGNIALRKIKLPDNYTSASGVYAHLQVRSNGDAYDRTGSLFVIPVTTQKQTMMDAFLYGIDTVPSFLDNKLHKYQGGIIHPTFDPPIEWMRFFTSFGVGHYNQIRPIEGYPWGKTAEYTKDVSDLIPPHTKEIWVGVYIGNYDKGGHLIDLHLNIYPDLKDSMPYKPLIQPLFYLVNILEMSGQSYGKLFEYDTLKVDFTVPENAKNLKLSFTATGHGGWGGGDEFNQKLNQLWIDSIPLFSIYPWRADCQTYRLTNPASGNFDNGMSSSDFSRSNWCPGTMTLPYEIPLPRNLKPGKHTLKLAIDMGPEEGGSFSHWNVSGVLLGEQH